MNDSKKIDNGGAAFPTVHHDTSQGIPYQHTERGMELRDYFAAKAMQGFLSNPTTTGASVKNVPNAAYIIADAMLKARNA